MKKEIIIFLLLITASFYAYSQSEFPPALNESEARLIELQAQVLTLDNYSPKQFPDFEDLEITNQLVELLEFNKRKFDLLIKQYNLFEDEIFPLLLKFSEENPQRREQIVLKLKYYSGQGAESVLKIQEEINRLALQIERMEKRIERVQKAAREKDIAEEKKQKSDAVVGIIDISIRIQKAIDDHKKYMGKIAEVKGKLKKLKEEEKRQVTKIEEKVAEIASLKHEAAASRDIVKKQINLILAKVKEIRVNGLEIPHMNTTKTFIYLTETTEKTLAEQAKNLKNEISSLKKIRSRELKNKGIKGVVIIFIAILLVLILNKTARRISFKVIDKIEKSQKVETHRKQRYQTLSSVILSFFKILSWTLALLWVLGELEIDYAPFLVAAGGISLAIGFGAQSLVKDVVTGFFILMEEQFALGDFVEIEGKSGIIEKISLRTVQFRSIDGTLNVIPNGNISSVSNATHQWSRAVVKVGISYDNDAKQAFSILSEICRQIVEDPVWNPLLIEEPIAQGILDFSASAVDFRVLAKTQPGKQWDVERELRFRIKNIFDEKGIEIPYNFVNIVDRTGKKNDD